MIVRFVCACVCACMCVCPLRWWRQLLASGLVYAMSMALYFRRSIVTTPPRRYMYAFVLSLMIASSMWSTHFTQLSDKVSEAERQPES